MFYVRKIVLQVQVKLFILYLIVWEKSTSI